jgi:hypothetical protein
MDTLTQWGDGKFKIEPSLFSLVDQPEEAKESEKMDEVKVVNAEAPKKETPEIKEEIDTKPEQVEKKNIPDLLGEFIGLTLARLVDLVGSHQIKEIAAEAHSKCKPYFPSLESFVFEIVPEIKIDLKKYENNWTEKETLGVAVYLETILKSCQNQVYGMSYLNLEELAGESVGQLKDISFFDFMSHAEEFKL